jgi:hypothetical protein
MSKGEKVALQIQWYTKAAGLHNLEGTAVEAGIIIGTAEGGIWGYALYPVLMSAAGTPEGQRVIYGIVDGLAPNPPTSTEGIIVREIARRVFE